MKFGEKLRAARKAMKISQQELAEKAGLGINTISNYEKGHTYPQSRDIYDSLAAILNTDPTFLRNEDELSSLPFYSVCGDDVSSEAFLALAEIVFSSESLNEKEKLDLYRKISDIFWASRS